MSALDFLFGLEQFGIKLGLDNIRTILRALGNPELSFRTVHIAGTNGKGSVTAMVDAGLRAAGHRVGRYTSPHLVRLNERFAIDGPAVDDPSMMAAIESVKTTIESLIRDNQLPVLPTFFEATTAVAFELFRRARVDFAVVEVGLGGRLDATNVVVPEVTAITSIDFDHQQHLGNTLEAIAAEKAGIIKPGVPVVIGALHADARLVIERIADERQAPIIFADDSIVAGKAIALPGAHQRQNAAIAVAILNILESRGAGVGPDAIDAALQRVEWPGRIDLRVLPNGRELILDAAHNRGGAYALASYLEGTHQTSLPLVFGAMRDKDIRAMFEALLPATGSVTLTRADSARAAPPEELAGIARSVAPSMFIRVEPDMMRALEIAWNDAPRIVVAGSIFLLGAVLQRLGLHC